MDIVLRESHRIYSTVTPAHQSPSVPHHHCCCYYDEKMIYSRHCQSIFTANKRLFILKLDCHHLSHGWFVYFSYFLHDELIPHRQPDCVIENWIWFWIVGIGLIAEICSDINVWAIYRLNPDNIWIFIQNISELSEAFVTYRFQDQGCCFFNNLLVRWSIPRLSGACTK